MIESSNKLKKIESHLLKLLEVFMSSQNILKYIYYLDNNPLANPNVKKDLKELGHIILSSFSGDIPTKDMVTVFFHPFKGNLKTYPSVNIVYAMNILIPNNKWEIDGLSQLRAYRIADEFSQLVDGQFVTGVGDVVITDFSDLPVGKTYQCLTLFIEVKTSSAKGLNNG